MIISVEFKDDAERARYLTNVGLSMKQAMTDVDLIEKAFLDHLQKIAQGAYIQGGLMQVQLAKQADLQEEAKSFFADEA